MEVKGEAGLWGTDREATNYLTNTKHLVKSGR